MSRTRASAKAAGTRFESQIAGYLAEYVDDRIERRRQGGAKDRGDIAGVRHRGQRVVIECKDTTRATLGPCVNDAEVERGNDDALIGVVAHKRHGNGKTGDQFVTMTLRDFVALLTGERPD